MSTSAKTFDDLTNAIMAHLTERNWQNNPPRGLAISIALEANELLEHYQWGDEPVGKKEELAGELADIMIYAIQFARYYDIDISEAIHAKLAIQAKKYPAENFQSADPDERRKAWLEAKKNHKKDTVL